MSLDRFENIAREVQRDGVLLAKPCNNCAASGRRACVVKPESRSERCAACVRLHAGRCVLRTRKWWNYDAVLNRQSYLLAEMGYVNSSQRFFVHQARLRNPISESLDFTPSLDQYANRALFETVMDSVSQVVSGSTSDNRDADDNGSAFSEPVLILTPFNLSFFSSIRVVLCFFRLSWC